MEPQATAVATDVLDAVAEGRYPLPHDVLGAHLNDGVVTIRSVHHLADSVEVLTQDHTYPATHEHGGVWVCVFAAEDIPDYRLRVTYGDHSQVVDDPYRFLPTVGEMATYLISEGRHERLWEVLGAHLMHFDGVMGPVDGVAFAVWAPNAQAVRGGGDFNFWDGTGHAMRTMGASGVWELFIPGVGVGARYKFEIQGPSGNWFQKADPMARATEIPPATASVVTAVFHTWNDADWLRAREDAHPCRFTRFTQAPGSRIWVTAVWLMSSSPTSRRWVSPTSNSCLLLSTPSVGLGATKSLPITHRPHAMALPMISDTLWTVSTKKVSE